VDVELAAISSRLSFAFVAAHDCTFAGTARVIAPAEWIGQNPRSNFHVENSKRLLCDTGAANSIQKPLRILRKSESNFQ
jgi:hypothetical protein